MSCDELRDLYELYALGALEPAERAALDDHLARGCETCRNGVKQALAVNAAVLALAPDVEPPSRLRKKVLAAVGIERPSWAWTVGWVTVTAGLLVCAFWFNFEAQRRGDDLVAARVRIQQISADADQMRHALAFLHAPETRQVGFGKGAPAPPRGNVFVNPQMGVLLVASNLPPAPPGKRYEMWLIPKKGPPKPAGMFQADPRGDAMHMQSGPLDVADTGAVAVTMEPDNGSPAPTGAPVIVCSMTAL